MRFTLSLLAAFCPIFCASLLAESPAPPDVKPKPVTGWKGNAAIWRTEGNEITATVPAGQELTKDEFFTAADAVHDFELTFEYQSPSSKISTWGLFYRGQPKGGSAVQGYEAILGEKGPGSGILVEEPGRGELSGRGVRISIAPDGRRWSEDLVPAKRVPDAIKPGEWNAVRLRAAASHVELWINGVLMTEVDDHQAGKARLGGALALRLPRGTAAGELHLRHVLLAFLGTTPESNQANVASSWPPSIQPEDENGKPLDLGFESGTLAGWKAEGDAWEGQPVKGDTTSLRQKGPSRHVGDYWIGGYEKIGDRGTGKLTSPSFKVTHPYASFLVGGGKDLKVTRVEVVVAATGEVIQSAAGDDVETMHRVSVDLRRWLGQKIFVRLVDESTNGWGHINYDDFVFHDSEPPASRFETSTNERVARLSQSPVLWHLQPNPAKPTAVPNVSAQKLVAGMMLTPGFQAELIAAEPEIRQPVAFAIDARGRIWVAEAYSYPARQPEGQGKDRILIFEDEKGDGSYSKRKVFMEGLNLVSGLEVGFGGVWVGAAPQLLFIPDRNGDDIPDGPPEVLLDGWGYQDTHETINSFCWGPDGWLYGNQGVFNTALIGKPGAPASERVPLHSGVWRYHPITHKFEVFAQGGSNQWGLDYNEAGDLFMTHCRSFYGGGGTTHVIRNGIFWNQANNNFPPFICNTAPTFAPDLKNFLPASAMYDSGEGGAGKPGTTAIYGGHSHVGTMIYLGDNWPEIYRDHLFTNNLFGAQMNHQENVREGSGYQTLHGGYDMLCAPDDTYMGIDLQTGPDGAVYIIDWSDTQHCHNPEPDKWDRTTGRLYRVSWASTYHPVKVNLEKLSDLELAELQTHHNDWYCRQARQLLQERAQEKKIDPAAIAKLAEFTNADSTPLVLHGLWTLHVVNALDASTVARAAAHPDDRVRAWAIRLSTDGAPALPPETLSKMAASDSSQTVRLALASALPTLSSEIRWSIGSALAAHGEDAADRFLPKMIWFGLAPEVGKDFARGLKLADSTPLPSLADSIRWSAAGNASGRDLLVSEILHASVPEVAKDLEILAFAAKAEAHLPMPNEWPQVQSRYPGAKTDELSAIFGDKATLARMRTALAASETPAPARRSAFNLLKRTGDAESTPVYVKLLDLDEYRSEAIPLLSRSNDPSVADALIERFPKLKDADRTAALETLTTRPALALRLLQAVGAGHFDRKYIGSFQVRQLRNLHQPTVDQLLDANWGKVNDSSEAAKATIARLQKDYDAAPLWAYDAKAGQQVFQQTCAVCHTLNGEGGKLGPDLTGSWHNGISYFLENIVDPNAVVGDQYQLTVVTKKDGSVVSGIFDQETPTALSVRTITETVVIPKEQIKSREKLAQSLMPPGLLEALPERKAIELLKYLTTKK
ncbi:MAG TPA: PVC-type heme-binding CxxCH protein [Chthoniobacteraceae bacterium]